MADGSQELSSEGSANCYIVPYSGIFTFKTVKGNSNESVGLVSSVEVLWETFGTNTTPQVGDLIKNVCYLANGYIRFESNSPYNKGNALIAAKDVEGKILWSWHIWLTDEPQDQVYYNNAGTMMDRNLGAISATPGDIGALGLFYQWGRKDPFLGLSSITSSSSATTPPYTFAVSTLNWPEPVKSDASIGTIIYSIEHPTTFIYSDGGYDSADWLHIADKTRWQSNKTIYDPCPPGYRVPGGDKYNVWSRAFDSSKYFDDSSLYDSSTKGFNFSTKLGDASIIWYPICGYMCDLNTYTSSTYCWTVTQGRNEGCANTFSFSEYGGILPWNGDGITISGRRGEPCDYGLSVRCLKE